MLIGVSCGGSDTNLPNAGNETAASGAVVDPPVGSPSDESSPDPGEKATPAGFGELVEGSFIFSGAVDAAYYVSDDALRFQLGGGCQGGAFGFSVNIYDANTDAAVASFGAEMQQDLAGGVIGEFDPVDAQVFLLPGTVTQSSAVQGPLRMIISEHDTGGADADLNARRMTVTLLGTIQTDAGDLDVDVTFRWVMGCP